VPVSRSVQDVEVVADLGDTRRSPTQWLRRVALGHNRTVPVSVTDAVFARHPELYSVESGVACNAPVRALRLASGTCGQGGARSQDQTGST
jgi:hypothetical protein